MMPSSAVLPAGVNQEALLTELRRLSWGAADILRAYARGEQPPHGFPKALSVDEGGEGPVSAADLAVNKWLLHRGRGCRSRDGRPGALRPPALHRGR